MADQIGPLAEIDRITEFAWDIEDIDELEEHALLLLHKVRSFWGSQTTILRPVVFDELATNILLVDAVMVYIRLMSIKKSHNHEDYFLLYSLLAQLEPYFMSFGDAHRGSLLQTMADFLADSTSYLVEHVPCFAQMDVLVKRFCEWIMSSPHEQDKSSYLAEIQTSSTRRITSDTDTDEMCFQIAGHLLSRIGVPRLEMAENEFFDYAVSKPSSDRQIFEILRLHSIAACTLVGKSKPDADYVTLFGKWHDGCVRRCLIDSSDEEIEKIIGDWDKHLSRYFPSPISLVEKWVQRQIRVKKYKVLGNSSLSKTSRKKILQQELVFYKHEEDETGVKKIKDGLQEEGVDTVESWLEEAKGLRHFGLPIVYSKMYLTQAIDLSSGYEVASIHALHALCILEDDPNSKEAFEDIRKALSLWKESRHEDMPKNTMPLLCSIFDILSIKGQVEFQREIHKVIIMLYKKNNIEVHKCVLRLWEYRRLSHALCPVPISDAFIDLTAEFDGDLDSMSYWDNCLRVHQPLILGFHNSFSFPKSSSQCHIDADSEISSQPVTTNSSGSDFVIGHREYDLSERLISNGRIFEALTHSKEAGRLRQKLMEQTFHSKTVEKELWCFDKGDSHDVDICYISRWNAVQCHLESILQQGIIHEILGDGVLAESSFLSGKKLSWKNGSTLFEIVFSTYLGKLYVKKQLWDQAEQELLSAKSLMKRLENDFCSKCRLLMEATVEVNFGELYQNKDRNDSQKLPTDLYNQAISDLKSAPWIKCVTGNDTQQMTGSTPESYEILDFNSFIASIGRNKDCICQKRKCWACYTEDVRNSGSLRKILIWKWEVKRRRVLLQLLTGLGKCLERDGQINDAMHVLYEGVSVLVYRNPSHRTDYKIMGRLLATVIIGDMICVERAALIYHLCWLLLQKPHKENIREKDGQCIPKENLVWWLILAFVLCREVPELFQQVSRLLATISLLSTASVLPACLPIYEGLSGRHYAAYFHQASIGTQVNSICCSMDVQDCEKRLVPDSIEKFNEFVIHFLKSLPYTTVCVSLLGTTYTDFLTDIDLVAAPAWMMISRLNSRSEPINILLPVQSVPAGTRYSEGHSFSSHFDSNELNTSVEFYRLVWGSSVVNHVADGLKSLLLDRLMIREDLKNMKLCPKENISEENMENLLLKIQSDIQIFSKDMEDLWFHGAWRFLLLGEWSKWKGIDALCRNLVHEFKIESIDIDPYILRLFLGGAKFGYKVEATQIFEYSLNKGCYVYEERKTISMQLMDKLDDALLNIRDMDCGDIEPPILVLDSEVQMVPWENMPVLRRRVTYRMPSVLLISKLYENRRTIDLQKTFYMMYPDGQGKPDVTDKILSKVLDRLKGTCESIPPPKELAAAFLNNDLFIYGGHGDGRKYLDEIWDQIQRSRSCPAAYLMGCSSSTFRLNGSYVPTSAPLSYLLAGSPMVFGFLWTVFTEGAEAVTGDLLEWLFQIGSLKMRDDHVVDTGLSLARDVSRTCEGEGLVIFGIPYTSS